MPDLKANLAVVKEKIAKAAAKSGRQASDITLVAVTKTQPIELIEQAIQAGITDIGENRVQEALPKIEALKSKYPFVRWHLLGHLQTNKVKQVIGNFDLIQSVDSERVGEEIDHRTESTEHRTQVLIEVNTSGERSKFGTPPEVALDLLQILTKFRKIKVVGLMTVGLFSSDQSQVRRGFIKLRELYEKFQKLNLPNVEMRFLSMGMTDDFEAAIEEGSNMIRIGRALFGQRGT